MPFSGNVPRKPNKQQIIDINDTNKNGILEMVFIKNIYQCVNGRTLYTGFE